jgi:hypothetical protein
LATCPNHFPVRTAARVSLHFIRCQRTKTRRQRRSRSRGRPVYRPRPERCQTLSLRFFDTSSKQTNGNAGCYFAETCAQLALQIRESFPAAAERCRRLCRRRDCRRPPPSRK